MVKMHQHPELRLEGKRAAVLKGSKQTQPGDDALAALSGTPLACTQQCCVVLQATDYLCADTQPAAEHFCEVLVRRHRGAPAAWALLKAESEAVRSVVLSHHPLLTGSERLGTLLSKLPKCLGLRAVRTRTFAAQGNMPGPALHIDSRSQRVLNELPPLLPALTDLRAAILRPIPHRPPPTASTALQQASLQSHIAPPPPLVQMRCSVLRARACKRGAPLPGWAALVATVCSTLIDLQHLELTCAEYESAQAFDALASLTGLTGLVVDCQRCGADDVTKHLRPSLAALSQLQSLVLLHSQAGQQYANNDSDEERREYKQLTDDLFIFNIEDSEDAANEEEVERICVRDENGRPVSPRGASHCGVGSLFGSC